MWWIEELDKHSRASNITLAVWCILLVPWALFALLAGMAFDAGPTWQAYTFVWSVWTYPVTLAIAALLRRRVPWLICAPLLNLAGFLIAGF
jgi:hypothetical protein